jgi:hypothetical protein
MKVPLRPRRRGCGPVPSNRQREAGITRSVAKLGISGAAAEDISAQALTPSKTMLSRLVDVLTSTSSPCRYS